MPEIEYRKGASSIDQVMAEFDRRKDHFKDLSNATERLINTILTEEKIPFQSVQARVKGREKLKSKYCRPDKDYKSIDEISDLVGLRIITYYSDKIDQIAEIIGHEFAECGPREDKRLGKPDSFGYSAIHLDCMHSPARLESTEYRRFANTRFEVQITTILGHAWAEMHHPWYDELNSPTEELRRFHRLAAVLELAEQEFLQIRERKEKRELVASVRVAAKAPEVPVTPESLKAFVEEGTVVTLNNQLAEVLGGTILEGVPELGKSAKLAVESGMTTIQVLEDKLNLWRDAIIDFVTLSKSIWDSVRPAAPRTYTKALCVIHLSYLLAAISGPGELKATAGRAGINLSSRMDVKAIEKLALDVATRHRLL